jgi:hypothetical protein
VPPSTLVEDSEAVSCVPPSTLLGDRYEDS